MVRIGCCGFPVAKIRYYSEFKVVEVQKTFYNPPEKNTLERWRREAPPDFEFVIKAWQLITHPETSPTYRKAKVNCHDCGFFRDSECVNRGMEKTLECAELLGARVIIFQTPASFRESEESIKSIINFFRRFRTDRFIFGWEHRGTWSRDALKYIYSETGLFEIVDPFKTEPLKTDFIYFRLHGIGGYRYRYTDEDLLKLKEYSECEGYIMFNNTNMFEDAKRFREVVSS